MTKIYDKSLLCDVSIYFLVAKMTVEVDSGRRTLEAKLDFFQVMSCTDDRESSIKRTQS